MPYGDSVTEAKEGYQSYRVPLWNNLKAAGCVVDFVGSRQGVSKGFKDSPQVSLGIKDFDPDHEGHWLYRTDELLVNTEAWASAASPDVVLIHAGTNDITQGQSVESTAQDIRAVVETFQRTIPGITVILAQLTPSRSRDAQHQALNNLIAEIASNLNSSDNRVVLVDLHSDFSAQTELFDTVHPNKQGEQKIADRFTNAILSLGT